MKCPLRIIAIPNEKSLGIPAVYECIKEECAVWNWKRQQCDPTGLVEVLVRLAITLEDLRDKMPHENQFRK